MKIKSLVILSGFVLVISDPVLAQDADWAARSSEHIYKTIRKRHFYNIPSGRYTVDVSFDVDKVGNVSHVTIEKPSDNPIMNAAAIAAVKAASPLPEPTGTAAGDAIHVHQPIAFTIGRIEARNNNHDKIQSLIKRQRPITPICHGC